MKISVAIATYNGAKYLGSQLDSIARQTRVPDEIVITDDGSSDDTFQLATAFGQSAAFEVRVHQNPQNLGYAQNFSKAISLSTGEFVFLSDQDDFWLPHKIERVLQEAERQPTKQVFMNDAFITDENLQPTGQTILGRMRAAGMGMDMFVHGSCIGVRRSFLDVVFPLPAGVETHDTWMIGLSCDYGTRVIIDEPLHMYRRHEEATSKASVTAQTNRISKYSYYRDLVKDRLKGDTVSYLDYYLTDTTRRLARVREWLAAASPRDELYGQSVTVIAKLERRQAAIRARLALLDAPGYKRLPGVAALAGKGQYAAFNGPRTALRDALYLDRLFLRLGGAKKTDRGAT